VTEVAGRRRRAGALGVDIVASFGLLGALMRIFSLAFLLPAAIAVGYGEPPWPFLAGGVATAAVGTGLAAAARGSGALGAREGFLVLALTWLLAALLGAIPYLLSGEDQLSSPVDALFESMSGFTTSGGTVTTDIPALPRSIAMWRQLTIWIGGMGIIVVALAVLPRLRVGGRQLFEAESPGPEVEPLSATIRESARRFLALYVAITAAMVLTLSGLAWSGVDDAMTVFDAFAHAFATVATGGFSPRARSLEEFGAATQWVVVFFMIVAGTNFALLYRAVVLRRLRALGRDEEFRLYVVLSVLASALIFAELVTENLYSGEAAVRQAVFQTVSTITTTGFASANYNAWTGLTTVTLIGLMFVGASAGSTSGSVKVVRHLLVARILRRELDQTVHPQLVTPLRVNGLPVDERTVRGVIAFVLLYVGIFAVGALAITLDAARIDAGITPIDAVAASASALGNVGPGFGIAGPMGSFADYATPSKLAMTALMWIGRLEVIPVVVLLTRSYWRR
jgi:trk system potassium uptake protein TrkH